MKKEIVMMVSAIAVGGGGYLLGSQHEENQAAFSSGSTDLTSAQEGNLLRLVDAGGTVRPLSNSKTWGKTSFDDTTLQLNYQTDVRPEFLRVGRNTPNGTRFLAKFPGAAVNLPLEFSDSFEGFNKWGDLNQGYYVQIAEHDFDSDDVPEIVVAVGNGLLDMAVNVVKYHAPQSSSNAARAENWELIGSFSGQQKAYLEQDTIELPVGSQGLFKEYTWVKRKFVRTD